MSEAVASKPLKGMIIGEADADAGIQRWQRIGLIVLALTFGVALLWSWLVPLSSAVVAAGTVKVDSSRKRIQHQEGGVIKEILVRDGSRVKAGEGADSARRNARRSIAGRATGQYDAALVLQARLVAERDRAAAIDWPTEILARRNAPPWPR